MNPDVNEKKIISIHKAKNPKRNIKFDKIWTSSVPFETPPIDYFENKNGQSNLAFSSSSRSIYPIDASNKLSSSSLKNKISHNQPQGLVESSHHTYPKVVPPKIRHHRKEKKPSYFKRKIIDNPKRFLCFKITIAFVLIIILVLIGFLILASIKPCLFTKCHKKASLCINRFPFWAQCICDLGYAGNGKSYCVECGRTYVQSNLVRVVGGSESVKSSWPFAAYIVQNYQGRFTIKGSSFLISYSWSCGGTILNQKTVLTAAHCIHDKNFEYEDKQGNFYTLTIQWNQWYSNLESTFEVYVGIYDLKNLTNAKKYRVKKVNKNVDFDDFTLQNDVATLQLDENIDLGSDTQYACLPYTQSSKYPEIDRNAFILGWGRVSESEPSDVLRNSKIKIFSENECSKVEANVEKNWESQVCAGVLDGSTDTCQGDSGGGLFTNENLKPNLTQYFVSGIVSYGDGCARISKPGIYSRTSFFLDWIRKNSDY